MGTSRAAAWLLGAATVAACLAQLAGAAHGRALRQQEQEQQQQPQVGGAGRATGAGGRAAERHARPLPSSAASAAGLSLRHPHTTRLAG